MATKQARSTRKLKPRHRAIKPRPARPLDPARAGNHEERSAARRGRYAAEVLAAQNTSASAALAAEETES